MKKTEKKFYMHKISTDVTHFSTTYKTSDIKYFKKKRIIKKTKTFKISI